MSVKIDRFGPDAQVTDGQFTDLSLNTNSRLKIQYHLVDSVIILALVFDKPTWSGTTS